MPLAKIVGMWRRDSQDAMVFRNVATSLLARGVSVISTLIAIPIILNYFGEERYGIWIISLTLGSLFTLADFGVVNAMLSMISRAYGANDRPLMKRLLSSALFMAVFFSLTFLAVLFASVWFFDWGRLLNIKDEALVIQAETVILLTGIGFCIQFPLAAIRHARLGMLQGVPVNLWDLVGVLLGTGGLVISIVTGAGLVTAVALWAFLPSVPKAISAVQFLIGSGRDLVPKFGFVERRTAKLLLASGAIFTLSGLSQALALQSDQLLIAKFLGLAEVAPYSIVQRLFSQPQILVTLLVAAQWPAYGEALGRGDGDWIIRHFNRSLIGIATFAIVCSAFMSFFCHDILKLWIGRAIPASPLLVAGMAIYCVASCLSAAIIAFYLALGLNRQVIFMQIAMFMISVPTSIALFKFIGSAGAVYGTSAGYLLGILLPSAAILRRTFRAFPRLRSSADAASQNRVADPILSQPTIKDGAN
jgi:O-antigen/teichoic acid export membrane protein